MDNVIAKMVRPDMAKSRGLTARLVLLGVLVLGLAVSMTALVTGAVFTDAQRVDRSQFTAGTIDISATPTETIVTNGNIAPGDVTTGVLTVTNAGSLEMRYSVQDLASNEDGKALHSQLRLAVYSITAAEQCTQAGTDSMTPLASKDSITTDAEALIGDNTAGNHPGDRVLASGSSELLCVRVALPVETPNAFQAASSDISFLFDAEQTANNP